MDNSIEASKAFTEIMYQWTRPSVLYQMRIRISKDGNQWCMLLGDNLQEGIAGFGDTVAQARDAFDAAFEKEGLL